MIQQLKKEAILCEAHCGIVGGHYAGDTTTQKIWNSRLWWPTTMKDVVEYCRQCDLCQRASQPNEKHRMTHQPVLPLKPFEKLGLDFVRPLN